MEVAAASLKTPYALQMPDQAISTAKDIAVALVTVNQDPGAFFLLGSLSLLQMVHFRPILYFRQVLAGQMACLLCRGTSRVLMRYGRSAHM